MTKKVADLLVDVLAELLRRPSPVRKVRAKRQQDFAIHHGVNDFV